MNKMWYIFTMEYYSAMKRNGLVPFSDMDGTETVTEGEVCQKEKYKYHIILLMSVIQKNNTDKLICKAEIEIQTWKTNIQIPRGEGMVG